MGCDVIGMTNMPEAKLAREAELCYASVAMITDYDSWHPGHDTVDISQIVATLHGNADRARNMVAALPGLLGATARPLPARLRPRAQPRDPDRPRGARPRSAGASGRGRGTGAVKALLALLLLAAPAQAQEGEWADFVSAWGKVSDQDFYRIVTCGAPPGLPCREPEVRWPPNRAQDLRVRLEAIRAGL